MAKNFGRKYGVCDGLVTSTREEEEGVLWHVQYNDGDEEDLNAEEFKKAKDLYISRQQA